MSWRKILSEPLNFSIHLKKFWLLSTQGVGSLENVENEMEGLGIFP